MILEQQELTAVEADTSEELYQVRHQARVIDWRVQGDVTEVAWASFHTRLAGETMSVFFHDTHARVIHSVEVGLEGHLIIDQR